MTADFSTEPKLALSAVVKQHTDLHTVSPRTILRWTTRGVRGVRLEAVRAGGKTLTSLAAVNRFLAALNQPATSADQIPAPRSPHQRQRESDAAARELAADGC